MIVIPRKDWSYLYSIEPPIPGDFNPDIYDPDSGVEEEDEE